MNLITWFKNPAREFREQTWNQKQTNLEFLMLKHKEWFTKLAPEVQDKMAESFMNLQRTRLWVIRNILLALFGLLALFFLKR